MLPKTLAPETRCVCTKPSSDPTLSSAAHRGTFTSSSHLLEVGAGLNTVPISPEPQSGAPVRTMSSTCPQKGSLKSPASVLSSSPTILAALYLQNKSRLRKGVCALVFSSPAPWKRCRTLLSEVFISLLSEAACFLLSFYRMQSFAPQCTKEPTAEVALGRDRGGSGRLGSSGVGHNVMAVSPHRG